MSSGLNIGEMAPDFELQAAPGEAVRLSDFRGRKTVVLFFYPKDETAGCTIEVCSFRDAHADFVDAGAEVIGISSDSLSSHERFAGRHQLPYRLLSDPGGTVAKRYGLHKALGVFPGRVTFVIDRAGIIRQITDARLRFKQHVTNSLEAVRTLPPPLPEPAAPVTEPPG
jgi:peroxiredoxin Q/BCP